MANNAPRSVLTSRRPNTAPIRGRDSPGPGQYNHTLRHKRAAPAYGMGTGSARVKPGKDSIK
jgi:hypothetical protein